MDINMIKFIGALVVDFSIALAVTAAILIPTWYFVF